MSDTETNVQNDIEEEEFIYLSDVAGSMRDSHLVCRDLGHSWKQESFRPDSHGLYQRKLVCRSCSCVRLDRVTRGGIIYGRSYDYPDEYQLPGWGAAIRDRSTFRRAVMQRAGLEIEEPETEEL